MQHLATSTADLAAFAARTERKEQSPADSALVFDQVLQQQTARERSHRADNKVANASVPGNEKDKISNKSTSAELAESEHKDSIRGDDVADAPEPITTERQSAAEDSAATRDKSPSGVDLASVAPEYIPEQGIDIEPQLADTWVSLVGKLQSLASMTAGKNTQSGDLQGETIEQNRDQLGRLLAADVSHEPLDGQDASANDLSTDVSAMVVKIAQSLKSNDPAAANSQASEVTTTLEQLLAKTDEQLLENKVKQPLLSPGVKLVDNMDVEASNALQALNEPQVAIMTDKEGGADPLKLLLSMSQGKLDKTLSNLAQRIVSNTSEPDSQSANQEFIAALQAGVTELKSQLAQGREPGLDLQALVAEAMSKANVAVKQPEQLEIRVKTFTQGLDVAQQLSAALDVSQASNANALGVESGHIPIEQLKQAQALQMGTQLDKAINITKPEGHQQLAEKVRWMVNAKQLVADIRLDPAELGAMQVKVSISGESATVNFVVQSHHARDALENATSKLRELLGERGIELGQSSVKQDQGGQDSDGEKHLGNGHFGNGGDDPNVRDEQENENLMEQPIVNGALGGIDYFV